MTSRAQINMYFAGAQQAVRMYAHWKDGKQYVGSTGKTLLDALRDLDTAHTRAVERGTVDGSWERDLMV